MDFHAVWWTDKPCAKEFVTMKQRRHRKFSKCKGCVSFSLSLNGQTRIRTISWSCKQLVLLVVVYIVNICYLRGCVCETVRKAGKFSFVGP